MVNTSDQIIMRWGDTSSSIRPPEALEGRCVVQNVGHCSAGFAAAGTPAQPYLSQNLVSRDTRACKDPKISGMMSATFESDWHLQATSFLALPSPHYC